MSRISSIIDRSSTPGNVDGTPPDHFPSDGGVYVWRTAVVMPFITFIFVALRLYTRLYIVKAKRLRLDDWVVALTMIVCTAHSVLIANATYNGMGLHVWQFTEELTSQYLLWLGIVSLFYVLGLCGFKSALLLLYIELFGVYTKFKWTCYGTLFFTVTYLFSNLVIEFLGCHPIDKKWHPELPGKCVDITVSVIFYGACNMATDLIIAILPLTMIWNLQLASIWHKVGLSLLLSSGFIAWAFAVVRWGYATYGVTSSPDITGLGGVAFTMSILELHTGLICCCTASLGPLWKGLVSWWGSWNIVAHSAGSSLPSFVRKPGNGGTSGGTGGPSHLSNGSAPSNKGEMSRNQAAPTMSYPGTTLNESREIVYDSMSTPGSNVSASVREDAPPRHVEDV